MIAQYDIGVLISCEEIAEGVSNSNWLIETAGSPQGSRFIFTLYERRIEHGDLPFFLALLDHLAAKGCPVPRTIHTRAGEPFITLHGKPAALIECMPGQSVAQPTPAQAYDVGRSLARIHLAAADFPLHRDQTLGLAAWRSLLMNTGAKELATIDANLPVLLENELRFLETYWPENLPRGVVHCDLFPDNVLMLGDEVSGLIDFYFSASDFLAYDLAVTHAAWCFAPRGSRYLPDLSAALMQGYGKVRPLSPQERAALPVLARGAAMRFIASRAFDWVNTPADATVRRKDPMEFIQRLLFYRGHGASIFTSGCGDAKVGA